MQFVVARLRLRCERQVEQQADASRNQGHPRDGDVAAVGCRHRHDGGGGEYSSRRGVVELDGDLADRSRRTARLRVHDPQRRGRGRRWQLGGPNRCRRVEPARSYFAIQGRQAVGRVQHLGDDLVIGPIRVQPPD